MGWGAPQTTTYGTLMGFSLVVFMPQKERLKLSNLFATAVWFMKWTLLKEPTKRGTASKQATILLVLFTNIVFFFFCYCKYMLTEVIFIVNLASWDLLFFVFYDPLCILDHNFRNQWRASWWVVDRLNSYKLKEIQNLVLLIYTLFLFRSVESNFFIFFDDIHKKRKGKWWDTKSPLCLWPKLYSLSRWVISYFYCTSASQMVPLLMEKFLILSEC